MGHGRWPGRALSLGGMEPGKHQLSSGSYGMCRREEGRRGGSLRPITASVVFLLAVVTGAGPRSRGAGRGWVLLPLVTGDK